jgi:hypothetical protein
MHLHRIVHPIETARHDDVHGDEGMVRGQDIIIERGSVVRKLSLILLFSIALFGLDALIVGGGAIAFLI